MQWQRIAKIVGLGMAGLAWAAVAVLTYSAGRGACPRCGYRGDLSTCKHCGWMLCGACWQKAEEEQGANICPHCKRGGP